MAKAKHERSSYKSVSGISILSGSGATMAVGGGLKSIMCSTSIAIGIGVLAGLARPG